jgi:competence protein ComEA
MNDNTSLSWGFMIRLTVLTSIVTALAIVAGSSLSNTSAQSTPAASNASNGAAGYPWPEGPGQAVVKKACLSCHSANVIVAPPGRTEDQWEDVISKMIGRGAIVSDDDADLLIDYLSTNFGPNSKSAHPASQAAPAQPSSQDKAAPPTSTGAAASAGPSDASAPLNVNKASADELQSALKLTKAEAELIVQHRERYGDFKNWQEVASVPGVPAKAIEQNQKRLTF